PEFGNRPARISLPVLEVAMSELKNPDTDQLLRSAAAGETEAADLLLRRHRERLKSLIGIRLDDRLAARVDPSDVVQDVLATAHQRLPDYLDRQPVAFYPWLRQIAFNRLTDLYRHHVQVAKRAVAREEQLPPGISGHSATRLAEQICDRGGSPSRIAIRAESHQRLLQALREMPDDQREIVVMRHLEQLSVGEVAEILDLPPGTVMSKHFRGLRTLRGLLND
ncbi:MAG: sigma-70 family RNA polymerase sigma factor, partial [Planctomycetota bacterium]